MIIRAISGAILLGAGLLIYSLGAPAAPQRYTDCERVSLENPVLHEAQRLSALDAARELYEDRDAIYGFDRRLASGWYGAKWQASQIAQAFGLPVPPPAYSEDLRVRAAASVIEYGLVFSAASALGSTHCATRALVPQSDGDSVEVAGRKLEVLVSKLERAGSD
ncbi:hypothetical protein VQ045_19615 [Aurantimonas sp. E1-2-R+4]|uniref:hypothetical protein n=1 Tax=Aurantimonas sp. E1-2-R+4 TaxID=3113714 RepID=UPI002F92FA4E